MVQCGKTKARQEVALIEMPGAALWHGMKRGYIRHVDSDMETSPVLPSETNDRFGDFTIVTRGVNLDAFSSKLVSMESRTVVYHQPGL